MCVQKGAPSFLPSHEPAPPPAAAPPSNIAIDIAAKRAEIQAKLAAMRAMAAGGGNTATPSPPPSSLGRPPLSVPGLPAPNLDPDLARKVAEAKRAVEAMNAKKRAAAAPPVNPYLVSLPSFADFICRCTHANLYACDVRSRVQAR